VAAAVAVVMALSVIPVASVVVVPAARMVGASHGGDDLDADMSGMVLHMMMGAPYESRRGDRQGRKELLHIALHTVKLP
jgi:hypothetical protein